MFCVDLASKVYHNTLWALFFLFVYGCLQGRSAVINPWKTYLFVNFRSCWIACNLRGRLVKVSRFNALGCGAVVAHPLGALPPLSTCRVPYASFTIYF